MNIESFIFGVQGSALNLMFLIIKRAILQSRTYKSICFTRVVLKDIYKRIICDISNLNVIQFDEKWGEYKHLIDQAVTYKKSNIL